MRSIRDKPRWQRQIGKTHLKEKHESFQSRLEFALIRPPVAQMKTTQTTQDDSPLSSPTPMLVVYVHHMHDQYSQLNKPHFLKFIWLIK